jgi:formiminoglutamase
MQTQITDDPFWPRASAWLAGVHTEKTLGTLAILGGPSRLGSITPGRYDLAPEALRTILQKFSCYDIESDADLDLLAARDLGDLSLADLNLEDAFEPLKDSVREALANADAVAVIGGNNGVTRPAAHGIATSLDMIGVITLDAHLDLRDLANGLTNGNPIRALLRDGLPGRNIAQIGIQPYANSRAYAEVARDAGITVITMNQVRAHGIEAILNETLDDLACRVEAIYVDIDIDVLDRIFAPATPGSRPGGLTPWELRHAAWMCGFHSKVRAIDLVEVDPTLDVAGVTIMSMASCLLSFASGLVSRLSSE